MARYSELRNSDSCSIYIDEYDRKEFLGQPRFGICDWIVLAVLHLVWIISLPVTWWCSFKVIPQYERAVVYRLGRLLPMRGPGLIYIIPCADRWIKVDMRMRELKVPPQEILTIDRAVLKVGADVQYRIADPLAANALIKDLDHSLRSSAYSALNSTLSVEKMTYAINEKQFLSSRLQQHMNKTVSQWGIEIARFELTHSCVVKGVGGVDPSIEDDNSAGATDAIVKLIKSFTSGHSDAFTSGLVPMPTNQGLSLSQVGMPQQPAPVQLLSPEDLIQVAKGVINEDLVRMTQAVFELRVQDGDAAPSKTWLVDLKHGAGCIKHGITNDVRDVRITTDTDTFQKLFYEQISAREAYMSSNLKVDGSINSAMKLEYLVKKLKEMKPHV